MLGLGRFDECSAPLGAEHVQSDGDYLQTLAVQFVAQRLPHGQVTRAASVRRPGVNENFLTAQAREAEDVARQIGKLDLGRFGRGKRP